MENGWRGKGEASIKQVKAVRGMLSLGKKGKGKGEAVRVFFLGRLGGVVLIGQLSGEGKGRPLVLAGE